MAVMRPPRHIQWLLRLLPPPLVDMGLLWFLQMCVGGKPLYSTPPPVGEEGDWDPDSLGRRLQVSSGERKTTAGDGASGCLGLAREERRWRQSDWARSRVPSSKMRLYTQLQEGIHT